MLHINQSVQLSQHGRPCEIGIVRRQSAANFTSPLKNLVVQGRLFDREFVDIRLQQNKVFVDPRFRDSASAVFPTAHRRSPDG